MHERVPSRDPEHHPAPPPVPATPTEQPLVDLQNDRQRAVLQKLEEGTEAILTSEGFQRYLTLASKFHQYSFQNTILIMVQRPEATLVNAYERWKKLNRQVQKGEHGIKIFYPMVRKIEEADPDTGELSEETRLVSFGVGNVFDVSQTEGEPLPEPPDVREHTETDDKATAVHLKLSRFLMDEGVRLSSEELHGHKRGYWSPDKRLIAVRRTEGVSPFAVGPTRTLVHEAAHFLADHRGQVGRVDAEAVAEGAAFVTMSHFGLDVGESSFPYIAGWAKDKTVLKRNVGEIQKVSSGLIVAIEGVGDPYADGYGAFAESDPWARSEDSLLDQEWEDRLSGGGQDDAV
jgi:antirestriction protein ArdC